MYSLSQKYFSRINIKVTCPPKQQLSEHLLLSVHFLLHHREADQEEVLHNFGFGGADVWRKIPERFFKSPSRVILCIKI